MYKVLEKTLRLIHPFMPFISEEIWQRLPGAKNSIMQQSWPHLQFNLINRSDESKMQIAFDVINTIRNMRAEMEVNSSSRIKIQLSFSNASTGQKIAALADYIKNLAKVDELIIAEGYRPQKNEFASVLKDMHIVMPLEGIADVAEQIRKNQAKIDKIKFEIKNKEAMLANKHFLSRAPKEIIDSERIKLQDMTEQVNKLEVIKNGLR